MLKQLTPEQIENNWHDLIDLINTTFEGERLDKLIKMYDYFEERVFIENNLEANRRLKEQFMSN